MTADIIDGKLFAETLRARVKSAAARLSRDHGVIPGLAVILVGEDPASRVYVANKGRAATAAGLLSIERRLPADASQAELLAEIRALNADPSIHGILVQLPLPKHIDPDLVIETIDPAKDVDGFHPSNVAALALGRPGMIPCTPLGCLMLLKARLGRLDGVKAVVLGRSRIVGAPMTQLLLRENATVTVAHSRTRDLPAELRAADVLVAAVGRPEMVRGDWIKPGATVIDVGINRVPGEEGRSRLVGDVHFESAKDVAGAITPVPGGVGPMTIACLMVNAVAAAARLNGLKAPEELGLA